MNSNQEKVLVSLCTHSAVSKQNESLFCLFVYWTSLFASFLFLHLSLYCYLARTTDTQWNQKSKKSEILGRCGRQNMLRLYLKIWDWDLIFGRAVKAISSPGVRSPWIEWFRLILAYINPYKERKVYHSNLDNRVAVNNGLKDVL